MALDVAILGADGAPETAVAIRMGAHDALMRLARLLGLPLLARLSEYYEDAEFSAGEVPALLAELERLELAPLPVECRATVRELEALAARAAATGRGIVALAD